VVRGGVVGFTPVVNGGILSSKKDRQDPDVRVPDPVEPEEPVDRERPGRGVHRLSLRRRGRQASIADATPEARELPQGRRCQCREARDRATSGCASTAPGPPVGHGRGVTAVLAGRQRGHRAGGSVPPDSDRRRPNRPREEAGPGRVVRSTLAGRISVFPGFYTRCIRLDAPRSGDSPQPFIVVVLH